MMCRIRLDEQIEPSLANGSKFSMPEDADILSGIDNRSRQGDHFGILGFSIIFVLMIIVAAVIILILRNKLKKEEKNEISKEKLQEEKI